jgi:hypothetical protein
MKVSDTLQVGLIVAKLKHHDAIQIIAINVNATSLMYQKLTSVYSIFGKVDV